MSRGLPMTYTGQNTCDKKVIVSLISESTFVKQLRKEIFYENFLAKMQKDPTYKCFINKNCHNWGKFIFAYTFGFPK